MRRGSTAHRQRIKELAYEVAVTAWDIYTGLAPITFSITAIVFMGLIFELLGWN